MKLHIFHTGKVCVAPSLPFGGDHCSLLKASGLLTPHKEKLWLPVSCYLIEHPQGSILVDTGWHRTMSPQGVFDKQAQIHSLGSRILYHVNQGVVRTGETITEQLAVLGIVPAQLDYVLLTHLDCDHANGLQQVAEAKHILVAEDELCFAQHTPVRYQKRWWQGVAMDAFTWNDSEGPTGKSYDLLGDKSVQLINIPGHADGLFAVKIRGDSGKFILLTSDGAYAAKSWEQLILPGIAADRNLQRASLTWIQEQSHQPDCHLVIANHDPDVQPQIIEF